MFVSSKDRSEIGRRADRTVCVAFLGPRSSMSGHVAQYGGSMMRVNTIKIFAVWGLHWRKI